MVWKEIPVEIHACISGLLHAEENIGQSWCIWWSLALVSLSMLGGIRSGYRIHRPKLIGQAIIFNIWCQQAYHILLEFQLYILVS